MNEPKSIQVACVQFAPEFGRPGDNVEKTIALMREAKSKGADLVVLPELCNTGYAFETRDELKELAEPIDGPTVTAWRNAASETGLHAVGGFAESSTTGIFNSAVLLAPSGIVGCHRKAHLSDREKDLFDPGDNDFQVHETQLGRISILICYDIWFPEAIRACALRRADIICVPTNWSDLDEPQQDRYPMAIYLLMAGAHSNGVFIACANRVGRERDVTFNGQSVIVDKTGWLVGDALLKHEEGMKVERCDLKRARHKNVSTRNSVIEDRREDLYE